MRNLDRRRRAAEHHDFVRPVELVGLAQRKPQRDEHRTLLRARPAPIPHMALHTVIGARVALGAQQLEQPPRCQPLARRPPAVRIEQSVKPRDKRSKPGLRLHPALVAKLVDDPRIALRTVRREIRNWRTIWRIGFLSTQNARLIRPIVPPSPSPATLPSTTKGSIR